MLEFWRERNSTAEEKRQIMLNAYLDNALPADERERFEVQLAQDEGLRADLERSRLLQGQMQAIARRRVPRSFALDPALYGRPKSQPLMNAYPLLRSATALAAIVLVFTFALGTFRGQFATGGGVSNAAPQAAMVSATEGMMAESEVAPAAAFSAENLEMSEPEEGEVPATTKDQELQGTEAPAYPAEISAFSEPTAVAFAADLTQSSNTNAAERNIVSASGASPKEEPMSSGKLFSWLIPLQIGLAIVFLLLLVLWNSARKSSRYY